MPQSACSFAPLPPERFAAFHARFQGDTWDVCERCGGKCEINKIGSLMPGEAEYIAASMGCEAAEFRRRYLDGISTPFGVVDVLKIKPGCPFLSPDYRCTIREFKVVLCDVYPIVFEVRDGQVHFFLDPWCPIVRRVPELARRFEQAIPELHRLGAPLEWYRAVELYDGLCVDYHRLFELRAHEPGYAVLTLEQVRGCLDENAPPPELRPGLVPPPSLAGAGP
jgi:Fe-S-cluster containining protein